MRSPFKLDRLTRILKQRPYLMKDYAPFEVRRVVAVAFQEIHTEFIMLED